MVNAFNFLYIYMQEVSDESDDIDFKPPTPLKKVCKPRSSRSPSHGPPMPTCTLNEDETEEAELTRRTCKQKGRGMTTSRDLEVSSSSGIERSSRRKRTVKRTAELLVSKRTPARRKPKPLEYLEDNSPLSKTEEACLTADELSPAGFATDMCASIAEDHRRRKGCPETVTSYTGSTRLDREISSDSLELKVHGEKSGSRSFESSHVKISAETDVPQSMNIDGSSLIDELFGDVSSKSNLPRPASHTTTSTVTKSSPLCSSETCSSPVMISKVELQSDKKLTLNPTLNIDVDELLFGF